MSLKMYLILFYLKEDTEHVPQVLIQINSSDAQCLMATVGLGQHRKFYLSRNHYKDIFAGNKKSANHRKM